MKNVSRQFAENKQNRAEKRLYRLHKPREFAEKKQCRAEKRLSRLYASPDTAGAAEKVSCQFSSRRVESPSKCCAVGFCHCVAQ